jgi:hypothetical protein
MRWSLLLFVPCLVARDTGAGRSPPEHRYPRALSIDLLG